MVNENIITVGWFILRKLIVIMLAVCSFSIFARPSAVLFDCDGVLVDTEYMKFEAWKEALSKDKISFTIEEYMPLVGYSSEHIANDIADKKNIKLDTVKLIAMKEKLYKAQQKNGVPPIKPAIIYLNTLLEQKDNLQIKIAVVSSDTHEAILRNLKFAGVKYKLLDGVFSGHDDLKHIRDSEGTNKPKPYIYQLAAQKLDINPAATIVFEDTNAGVVSASLAGMIVIAVPNQFTEHQDFSKARVVTSFKNFSISDLNSLSIK